MRAPLKQLLIAATTPIIGLAIYQLVTPSAAERAAVDQLANVQAFSFGEVGFVGMLPERESWFFTILSSRHSKRLLRELFERGTPAARLYALNGLHVADKNHFKEYAARFAQEGLTVRTEAGCTESDEPASMALAAVENGRMESYLEFKARTR